MVPEDACTRKLWPPPGGRGSRKATQTSAAFCFCHVAAGAPGVAHSTLLRATRDPLRTTDALAREGQTAVSQKGTCLKQLSKCWLVTPLLWFTAELHSFPTRAHAGPAATSDILSASILQLPSRSQRRKLQGPGCQLGLRKKSGPVSSYSQCALVCSEFPRTKQKPQDRRLALTEGRCCQSIPKTSKQPSSLHESPGIPFLPQSSAALLPNCWITSNWWPKTKHAHLSVRKGPGSSWV